MKLKVTTIQWNGNNYAQIIRAFGSFNQELKIQIKGKRLVVKDTEAGFYRVFSIGDILEAPARLCEPDEPLEIPEPEPIPVKAYVPPKQWSRGGVWGEDFKTLGEAQPELFNA